MKSRPLSYCRWLCRLFLLVLAIEPLAAVDKAVNSDRFPTLEAARSYFSQPLPEEESKKPLELLNVSFDPTRSLYEEVNVAFANWWKEQTGQTMQVRQSHGGSGKQARSIAMGLEADVATLALAYDLDMISQQSGWLPADWAMRLPNHSVPFTSTVVFLVRKGNPKQIKDWDDLIREGVTVIMPNPKTSGGARWNYLAAWGYASERYGGDQEKIKAFMKKLLANIPILDTGARAATMSFIQRSLGDVLVTWENEAHLALQEQNRGDVEIVVPSLSIRADTPVAWLDKVIDKKGTRTAAERYLTFLYTVQVQKMAANHFFRPIDPEVAKEYEELFPRVKMLEVERDFGGWKKVQKEHFDDGGSFDQIYGK